MADKSKHGNGQRENVPSGHAVVAIDERIIEDIISLRPDIRMAGMYFSPEWRAFIFHLEGDALPAHVPGAEAKHCQVVPQIHLLGGGRTAYTYDVLWNGEKIGHIGWEQDVAAAEAVAAEQIEHIKKLLDIDRE